MTTNNKSSKETAKVVEKKTSADETLERRELAKENAELRRKLQEQEDNTGIPLDAYIEVMSLVPFKLNLSTEKMGKGRQFSFSRYGEIKRILYNDLASIFENYRTFMEQGYFYILSQKVIRKHGLDDMYLDILSKEEIDKILSFDLKSAIPLYKKAGVIQREIIDGMLVKIVKNKAVSDIDFNIISKISEIGGRNILEIAQDMKKLEETPQE